MIRPQPSDLLLLRTSERVYVFVVGVDQDAWQSSSTTYDRAHARALRTAVQARVNVWETDDGFSFVLVAHNRQQHAERTRVSRPFYAASASV